jgi:rare lipoprotein A (peptidoglycan hydrolase)
VFVVLAAALTATAPALASSGGGGISSGGAGFPSQTGSSSGSSASTQDGNVTVSDTGNGITLVTHASAILRNQLSFTGTAAPSDAGATIEIERLGHQTNWQWTPTVRATVGSDGSFSARWHANHIGRFSIRAVLMSSSGSSGNAASTMPTVTVTVYRQAIATQYGPGFYGQRTACGIKLKPSTIGVANRTLKCGTKVSVYYEGRTMVIPVIDRGPYANNADWDLTTATAKALGIDGTATIGAVSLPPQPSQP